MTIFDSNFKRDNNVVHVHQVVIYRIIEEYLSREAKKTITLSRYDGNIHEN